MDKISLYIHIPFCAQKCLYCDFPSFARKDHLRKAYIEALNKEIISLREKHNNLEINTIFIGGGTPSVLEADELECLLKEVAKLNMAKDIEYSMECNPGNLTEEKLEVMKKYGVNRISMGLQAKQDNLLKGLGRIHNYKTFKENFLLAKKVGFNNINVDLMFGLPNQRLNEWEETLREIISLEPAHISAYSLIIEEGTAFYNLYENDKLKLPTEEEERKMYHLAKKILEENGFNQYEISNYAKEGKECRHNLAYWNMDNWIGVGSAAASYINGKRIKNISSVEKYINSINEKREAVEEIINNSKNDNMEEFMFMGLRKINGIDENEFKNRFSMNINDVYGEILNKYIDEGLLIRESGRIFLSEKGIEISNIIMADFLL
ncbi:radical SAM family heme chaperone HemW [Clostridium perfringens]|jgi:oxygen-independent coproporphyrinogen-3 oxidase|uniref:Heme chaperone HemW n=3 Tax=Clostridium perfringens TaxID=1502 RepID=Q8XIS8_CLOPE|nr:radical SAM family heme chaperone HemW [Clostridium perfringens]ASY52303.1 coproporphyrinogen III oxidase [Clostridium perfringens]AWS26834.1 coproporphyrinogen III oxidase [Clostridium perfringens]EDT25177.1 putative oxygen-independent coproporphyrinogen III oxidase [Clostridium perfringens B str. ATCC 3626]EDT27666.1 putative oxygen-independent coproporphyrinogen III oxidase [Clostridium perfringens CPE str. F4969]EGT0680236.1 oxygen-independent coproporphyrinogen III oxidase [Clostridium